MAPIGEDRAIRTQRGRATRPRWSRAAFALASPILALALAGSARAGDDEGPELTRPDVPGSTAPAITSTPAKPAAAPPRRAVLALPGLTSAAARQAASAPPAAASEPTAGPSLDVPLEMPTASPDARANLAPLPGQAGRSRATELAPLDLDLLVDEKPKGMRSSGNRSLDPLPENPPPRPTPAQVPNPGQPARRGRMFGLFPGAAATPPPARSVSRPGAASAPGIASAAEPKADSAADSALRRRIESQARVAVGDRARSVEVRVLGKSAMIQARGVKFYQKRAVRKSLESLPAIAGVRTTIDVNE